MLGTTLHKLVNFAPPTLLEGVTLKEPCARDMAKGAQDTTLCPNQECTPRAAQALSDTLLELCSVAVWEEEDPLA